MIDIRATRSPVIPAKAGIQYAAASRFYHWRSGILGRPVKPGDDTLCTCGDLPVGLFRVQCARQNISLPRLVETALLIPSSRPTEGRSAHEAAGATGIRRSPRPLWAEDSSTARAHCAAIASTCV